MYSKDCLSYCNLLAKSLFEVRPPIFVEFERMLEVLVMFDDECIDFF